MSGDKSPAQEKVLLFGGSFDPPHQGHVNLLQNAIAAVRPARVLVIPSGTAPHKRASETPAALRAQMCACFEPLFPALKVSAIEMERGGRSYTVDTVQALRTQWPTAQFYLSIGGDMLLSFTTWHRYRALLDLATLVVQARTGAEQAALDKAAKALAQQGGRVLMAPGPVVPASSSAIRSALAAGRDVWALIPPAAAAVIRAHHLYGT
ncbi:MAG: nicotinate (nicotinamide) nucleotide adenylyltransferase [Oscillospiraceae bacterium]